MAETLAASNENIDTNSLKSDSTPQVVIDEEKEKQRRDFYGFQIKDELIEDYGLFIDKYMDNLQHQNECFEKFAAEYTAQLDEGIVPPLNSPITVQSQQYTLLQLVKKGIPPKYRGKLWQIFCGTKQILHMSAGIYQQVLKDHEDKESEAILQIEKDIKRTFSTNIGSFSRDSLRRVLVAYSWKNESIGYCQAMNFITAGLLIFMGEEEAFWVLSYVVEKLLPDYFNRGLTGSRVDALVLESYLKKRVPKVYKHFRKMQMELSVVATQWLMCLFLTSVPNETAFRIWDATFLLGPKVIFEVALAIFKTHEKQLLATPDVTEIGVYLNRAVTRIFNCDELFDVSIKPLEDKKIMKLREQYKAQINKEMREKRMTFLLEELASNTHFTSEELNQLWSQYEQLDPNTDFGINMEAFTRLYLYLFQDRREDKQFIQQMFKAFDSNRDNLIDFKELVYGLSILLRGTVEEKLQLCFKVFDLTAVGSVNYETMTEMLSSVYNLFCQEDCSKEVTFFVDMIFQAAEVPKETTLTYEQFKQGIAMQPFIMKCFNLDSPKQSRYSLSISNNSSASSGESGSWSPSITKSGSYIDLKPLVTFFKDRVKKT